jgi:hypothetical protein
MLISRRLLVAGALALAALGPGAVAVPAASAAAPVIKSTIPFGFNNGLGRLNTQHNTGLGGGTYSLASPSIRISPAEAGTLTFIGRDWTGRALGKFSGPVSAGSWTSESDLVYPNGKERSIDSYIFPTTILPCTNEDQRCGEIYQLKYGSLYSVEAFFTNAAGQKSRTVKVYGFYLGIQNSYSL